MLLVSILASWRKYVVSASSLKKTTIWSKNLPVEGTEGGYCGIQILPAIRFEAASCRWKLQNYFGNLEWQFVSKFKWLRHATDPFHIWREQLWNSWQMLEHEDVWMMMFAPWREYKFKFASNPYHANLRTKQIVIDIIDIMKLFENWGSNFFGRCYPSPF